MGILGRRDRDLARFARRTALGVGAAQAAVVAGLTATDAWRKRVRPQRATFPRSAPAEFAVGSDEVKVYAYGADLYEDMLAAIDSARHRVMFESFIVKGDELGERFKRALIEAAERGVEVYVIYDGFANLVVRRSFFDFPSSVHVLRYPALKPGMLLLDVRKSGRDHRKLLAVDGLVGFVGGYNVGSAYATQWRDTHLRVKGPSAWGLENAFIDFWNDHAGSSRPRLPEEGSVDWEPRVRVHRNLPSQLIYPIRGVYLEAIDRARERVAITQPYFIPDREMMRALLGAARRGVTVDVLVPATSNHVVADWLSRGFYTQLLEGGVRMWLYEDAMVHAKTMTIDGLWSTVGTANIDRLSLTGNYEINLEVFDDGLADHLERIFRTDLTNAHRLTLGDWQGRSLGAKFVEGLLAPLRPLM
ncbi:phosphatidylserine/phosphatidylglycerophosphate/cardiolipin synthase family protein [Thermoleophilia bacterium SCSIO 60948]|nr:phosphatidylserine/phosphatidylglycerophosphate/cardiolipin synthase family protein [Thermoleophilia bacterium SCSIO 60948]